MLAALTKYLSRHFSSFEAWERERDRAREGDSIPVYLTECVHVWVDLCAFLTATVVHACPRAGHKSSLEMAGVCLCVFVCACECTLRHTDWRNCSLRWSTGCLIVTASVLCSTPFPRFLKRDCKTHTQTLCTVSENGWPCTVMRDCLINSAESVHTASIKWLAQCWQAGYCVVVEPGSLYMTIRPLQSSHFTIWQHRGQKQHQFTLTLWLF